METIENKVVVFDLDDTLYKEIDFGFAERYDDDLNALRSLFPGVVIIRYT